jgi:hypothetical protein
MRTVVSVERVGHKYFRDDDSVYLDLLTSSQDENDLISKARTTQQAPRGWRQWISSPTPIPHWAESVPTPRQHAEARWLEAPELLRQFQ